MIQKKRIADGMVEVTFAFVPTERKKDLYLVGDFNDWKRGAHPMVCDSGGTWRITLPLKDGKVYEYLFQSDADETFLDPDADGKSQTRKGEAHSVLQLIAVRNPYRNTPYDILSDPADPAVGEINPESPQKAILAQQGRVLVKRKRKVVDITTAARALGYPDRIAVDAFLCSLLNLEHDLNTLAGYGQQTPRLQVTEPDWSDPLPYWLEAPEETIALPKVKINPSKAYEDPRSELIAVRFDL